MLASHMGMVEKRCMRPPSVLTSYTCGKVPSAKMMLRAVGMMLACSSTWLLSRHVMGYSSPLSVVSRLGVPPSLLTTYTSMLPSRLEAKAMRCPSGLHTG